MSRRVDRQAIGQMTRVSHDSAPPFTVSVCQGHKPPADNLHCGIFPHFYLYIYFITSLSRPLLFFPPFFSSTFFLCVCVYQTSSFYMAAGLPPHTPGLRCCRSKGGGRSLSVMNFNFCARYRYFHEPPPILPPTFLLCV